MQGPLATAKKKTRARLRKKAFRSKTRRLRSWKIRSGKKDTGKGSASNQPTNKKEIEKCCRSSSHKQLEWQQTRRYSGTGTDLVREKERRMSEELEVEVRMDPKGETGLSQQHGTPRSRNQQPLCGMCSSRTCAHGFSSLVQTGAVGQGPYWLGLTYEAISNGTNRRSAPCQVDAEESARLDQERWAPKGSSQQQRQEP